MEPKSSPGLPVWLLLLATLGAIVGFCWSEHDYVAATVVATIAMAGLWGYYVGAMRLLGFWSALMLGCAGASPVGMWLSPRVAQGLGTTPGATRLISLGLGGAVTFVLAVLSASVLVRWLLRGRPQLDAANRLVGFGVGGLQGTAALLLLLGGILVIEPQARQRLNVAKKGDSHGLARGVARRVVEIAEQTRRSAFGTWVDAYNPFERVPQIKNLHRAATVVSNPAKLQQVLQSPTVTRTREKSDVRRAIESLAQDPQIRKLAESGQPLDPETAMSLLNHPGIAKLLEQPDLMRQLTDTMSELESQSSTSRPKSPR